MVNFRIKPTGERVLTLGWGQGSQIVLMHRWVLNVYHISKFKLFYSALEFNDIHIYTIRKENEAVYES